LGRYFGEFLRGQGSRPRFLPVYRVQDRQKRLEIPFVLRAEQGFNDLFKHNAILPPIGLKLKGPVRLFGSPV
jgi:hypothetical protein